MVVEYINHNPSMHSAQHPWHDLIGSSIHNDLLQKIEYSPVFQHQFPTVSINEFLQTMQFFRDRIHNWISAWIHKPN